MHTIGVNPVQAAIDATAVNSVMQGLRNLGVEEFVEGDDSDPAFGLDRDFFTVSVVGQFERRPIHVRLGRDEGEQTFARRDGEDQVVKIPKAVADRLRQPWIRFVAPQVQQLTAAVGELRIVQEDREIGYHRGPDGWRARGSAAPDPLVGDLVDDLKDLRADAVLDPASTELPEESYRLQLRRANGDQLAELRIYDRGEGQPLLVRIERIDVLFELRASESQRIRALLR